MALPRRLLYLLTAALVMLTMLVASAMPALAGNKLGQSNANWGSYQNDNNKSNSSGFTQGADRGNDVGNNGNHFGDPNN